MTLCRELQNYLCRDMSAERGTLFEQHLAQCQKCQADKHFWERFDDDFDDWSQSIQQNEPTEQNVQQFMESAAQRSRRAPLAQRPLVWVLVSSVVAAAVVIIVNVSHLSKAEVIDQTTAVAVEVKETPPTAPIQILENGSTEPVIEELNGDTLGLDVGTRLAVVQSTNNHKRLRLERGAAAFDVQHKGADQQFQIQVQQHVVSVVGTRFSVSVQEKGGFEVAVIEGAVRVHGPESQLDQVEAGYQFTYRQGEDPIMKQLLPANEKQIDLLLGVVESDEERADTTPADPSDNKVTDKGPSLETVSTYKKMIVSGRLDEARGGLRRYVKANPNDDDGWMLLAECERKFKNWPAAVRSFQKAMDARDPRTSAKAKYMAAELLGRKMNRHKEAVKLYEDYLEAAKGGSLMHTAAKVSMGRSLIALGQKKKARKILQEVLDSPGDTFVAKNAKHLLESLDEDK